MISYFLRTLARWLSFLAHALRMLAGRGRRYVFPLIISLLVALSTFPLHKVQVSADTCATETAQDPNGKTYCAPSWVAGNPGSLQVWRNIVSSGSFKTSDLNTLKNAVDFEQHPDVFSALKYIDSSLGNGSAFRNAYGYFSCLFGGKGDAFGCSQQPQSHGSGAHGSHGSGGRYIPPSPDSNRYFSSPGASSGETVGSEELLQNYNIINNISNYHYSFVNSSATYTTNNNISYNVINDYRKTIIVNNSTGQRDEYYFRLPDGNSSYNLTDEEVKGLKTDFVVSNYAATYDYTNISGLYHLDGTLSDSSFNNGTKTSLSFEPSSITYKKDGGNFDGFLQFSQGSVKAAFSPLTEGALDFRFFPTKSRFFSLRLGDEYLYSFRTEVKKDKLPIETTSESNTTVTWTVSLNYISGSNVPSVNLQGKCKALSSFAHYTETPTLTTTGYSYDKTGARITHYNKTVIGTCTFPTKTITKSYQYILSDVHFQDGDLKGIQFDVWNHLKIRVISPGHYGVYLNGIFVKEISAAQVDSFTVTTDGNVAFDEFRFVKKDAADNFTPSSAPYDSNLAFVLPDIESDHKILIQSIVPVTDYQIGGKRSSDPKKGNVFISVDDNGLMESMQQYDGSQWLPFDGAIFSQHLGKWVSYKGYSVKSNNWTYTDINPGSSGSATPSFDLSKLFEYFDRKFNELITTIKENVSNSISNTFNAAGSNFWDFLISISESIGKGISSLFGGWADFAKFLFNKIESAITSLFGGLTGLIKWLFVPKDEGFLSNNINGILESLNHKFNISFSGFDISGLFSAITSSESPAVIDFEGVVFQGVTFIPGFHIDFNELLESAGLSQAYSVYKTVVTCLVLSMLYNLGLRKVKGALKR